jgi:hypothetical protein
MPVLNHNIEPFEAWVSAVRFNGESAKGKYYRVMVHAIQSVAGKILTFHVLTDFGMHRSRVQLSDLFWKIPEKEIPYDWLELWDMFSENVTVTNYEFLAEKRCEVILKDSSKVWGKHTGINVDWYNNGYSDLPNQYKSGHLIALDTGHYALMPNNRLIFRDMNFVTKPFPCDLKEFVVDKELLSVENVSDRWVSGDGENFYYEIKKDKT